MPRPKFLWAYALVLHLALLLLVLRIAQPSLAIWGPVSSVSQAEIHYVNMVQYHERGDAALPPGRVLFLGDSITQGLPVAAATSRGVNYGIGSDDTVGLLARLEKYESINSAAAVVIAMGSNDMNRVTDAELSTNYEAVLDAIPSDVPVICSAILPIDEPVRSNWLDRSNKRIIKLNTDIESLCTNRGYLFVDPTAAMSNDDGNLKSEFHVGDGLHLNADGNAQWIVDLKAALQQLGIDD